MNTNCCGACHPIPTPASIDAQITELDRLLKNRRYKTLLADMKAIARCDLRSGIRMHEIALEAVCRETKPQEVAV